MMQFDLQPADTRISKVEVEDQPPKDMDLIEVLWRVDMDLGVGREMFDINLRKEMEKEQEIELQKQREREKELELLQVQADEKVLDTPEIINYVVDNETGELIPASSSSNTVDTSAQQIPENLSPFGETDEGLSIEDAMRLLEQQDVPANKSHSELAQNFVNATQLSNTTSAVTENNLELQQNYQRQSSFEQRWQDIANVLNLPPPPSFSNAVSYVSNNNNNNFSFPENAALHNANITEPDIDMSLMHNDSSVIQGNVSFAADLNTPLPSANNSNLFDLDNQELLFPNVSDPAPQPDTYNQSSALLQELLNNDITNLELPELVDGLHMQMVDDASSDSAVSSMESMTSHIQDINEFNDTSSVTSYIGSIGVSPSMDGIEGATGGDYDATCSKYVKYEKYDFDQNDDGTYSDFSFPEDMLLNQSCSSNDSECSYKAADMRHVRHNHSYPLQPGQQPKEPYNKPKRDSKSRMHTRDELRAKKMNIPLTLDQIINSAVEEFNDLLQKYAMTEQQLQLVRDIRRRGKNKVAAQNCRKRKMDVLTTLEVDVNDMAEERNKLKRDNRLLESEINEMRGKFQHLYQEVFQSLRDENGQPYDPSQYSLQQASDGNVFLVPRNATTDTVKKDKQTKKKGVKK